MPNHVTNELTCEHKTTLDSLAGGDPVEPIDFNKIVSMPESLHGDVSGTVKDWARIAFGVFDLTTLLNASVDVMTAIRNSSWTSAAGAMKRDTLLRLMTAGPAPKDFDDAQFEQFIHCIRCLRQFGHAGALEWAVAKWGTKWNAYHQSRVSDTVVQFHTAWTPPTAAIQALSRKYPAESFRLRWASENVGYETGIVTFKGGELVYSYNVIDGSPEAHRLANAVLFTVTQPSNTGEQR